MQRQPLLKSNSPLMVCHRPSRGMKLQRCSFREQLPLFRSLGPRPNLLLNSPLHKHHCVVCSEVIKANFTFENSPDDLKLNRKQSLVWSQWVHPLGFCQFSSGISFQFHQISSSEKPQTSEKGLSKQCHFRDLVMQVYGDHFTSKLSMTLKYLQL